MKIERVSDEHALYLRDESRSVGKADYIAFPVCDADVFEALAFARENGLAVTTQGGRTGLAAGAVPRGGLVLNLSRMDKILGPEREGETVLLRVQPGVLLVNLRKYVEGLRSEYGPLFFPPDPTETTASIGGMTACNASGARTYFYGPTRRYVEGLRVILADGRTVSLRRGEQKASGRFLSLRCEDGSTVEVDLPSYRIPAVKNASGYYVEDGMDAVDLFVGSDGTLGIVTEVLLRLEPLPPQIWECGFLLNAERDALDLTEALRKNCSRLASIEFFDEGALRVLRERKAWDASLFSLAEVPEDVHSILFVEIHADSKKAAFEELEKASACLAACNGDPARTWFGWNAADIRRFKDFRHAVPESVNMLIDVRRRKEPGITKLGTDMSVPDRCLHRVFALYREGLSQLGLQSAVWGHIGNNHVHVNILPNSLAEYARAKELYGEWAKQVTEMGGAVSAEHGVGKLKASFLETMYGASAIGEMRALKRAFDPACMLNPGNLFGTGD
ncbi:MAG: FAD-binding oxidoreductase [Firmicutes bacterium]|nr:FAD-binding oxidoreductase [Bacillota bacterium]